MATLATFTVSDSLLVIHGRSPNVPGTTHKIASMPMRRITSSKARAQPSTFTPHSSSKHKPASRPCERKQSGKVVLIGGLERGDVGGANLSCRPQIAFAPGEGFASQSSNEKVRHEARPPTISVREWMDINQGMMETHREFIRRVDFVLNPGADIVIYVAHVDRHLPIRRADILIAVTIFACPTPDFAEHATMQALTEIFLRRIVAERRQRPSHGRQDILLLKLVE